ncbi:hypothetical protein [Clostridium aminobutyricum]|uniref:Uncharacterized protein n=1 Tax=Clostridium aminobutyricum TaxID=33953 RepID=A0A939DAD0_CLOAM|nr:hypothetical protein [Clostridium aminobutyricum]MBN7774324.1 hypothetical protein [Clostridium aminobutyricum]
METRINYTDIVEHKNTYIKNNDLKLLNNKLNFFEIRFNLKEIKVINGVCQELIASTEKESIRWYALQTLLSTSGDIISENTEENSYKIPLHLFELEEYMKVFGKYNSPSLSPDDHFVLLRIGSIFEISQHMYRDIIKKYVNYKDDAKLTLYLRDWAQFENRS